MKEVKGNFESDAVRATCNCKCSQFDDQNSTFDGASNGQTNENVCRCSCLFSDDRNEAYDGASNSK
ncbi:MAG: hypothetical protein CVU84_09100 [Firmicutes bacterium HGW-Firmicutes-1]|nr:MAG: hypothetical protein CVU84_09100 [Firmicutes bacterium HGW-Firmicutes-1]